MRVPESLAALFDYGVLEDVVRPLMSGKEAQVYLVVQESR
jgi:RIO kinase 1